jgi:maltose O-acetyltransferase
MLRKLLSRAVFIMHHAQYVSRETLNRIYLRLVLRSCGKRLRTQGPFVIMGASQVEFGDDVSFAAFLHIWGFGGVKIGNRVMIASHVAITSSTHDRNAEVMKYSGINRQVIVEDDVWIGSHCVILPGVQIGHSAVIAAGAVVNRNVPAYSIVGGVPAKILRVDRRLKQGESGNMPE